MDRTGFLKLLGRHLYPVLRAEGFKGSGSTLRRIEGPVIHVFNVQGSTWGGGCYLNLGAHLDFLPPEGGQKNLSPASFHEYHCIFRDRIDPPTGGAFPWAYGNTPDEAAEVAAFIVSEWATQGRPFFEQYWSYPASFLALIDEANPDQVNPRVALHYARIAAHLGRPDRASAFARAGLANAPEAASYLRADLTRLLDGSGNA